MTPPASSRRRFLGQLSSAAALALTPGLSRALEGPPPGKKLGVALVGLGNYSTNELGPALRRTKHCRLAGVVTGDPAKGRRWARDYGFPVKNVFDYQTMGEIGGNPEIDAIYVVTPNGLHAEHAIAAARTGKHVICEKPMANSVAECDAMIAACQAAGVQLAIGYRLHFEPHHLELIRLARDRDFGVFQTMAGENGFRMGSHSWRIEKKLSGGGPLMDMGVYVIQAVCMAKEEVPPPAVTAQVVPTTRPELFTEVEEVIDWTMEFADGARARCRATYADSVSRFRAEGAAGWAELPYPAFYYEGQRLLTSRGPVQFPAVNHQVAQLDGMARCFRAGTPTPVPGEMGRRDVAIIEAIYASAAAGGRRTEVKG